MTERVIQERFEGTLLGLAVGDALGGPVEFAGRDKIIKTYGVLKAMVGGGWLGLKPGEYTDDTTMMLCIAESFVENKGYNPEDIAQRFVSWCKSGPKDIGSTTRQALNKIASGTSWKEAGDREKPTNGSVMRCPPVGLVYFRNEPKLVKVSEETSAITHAHKEAVQNCIFINVMISHLVQGVDRWTAFCEAMKVANDLGAGFQNNFLHPDKLDPAWGSAVNTTGLALSSFMGADSFEEAVVRAVNLGGDADTIGAVAGSLAGAYWGVTAIPERWFSKINPYSAMQIVGIADKLYELAEK